MKRHELLILTVSISIHCSVLSAQVISVTGTAVNGLSTATANDFLAPVPPPGGVVIQDVQNCAMGAFIPGLFGNDFAAICFVHAKEEGLIPAPHEVSCYIGNRVRINGDNSQNLEIKFKNTGTTYATTDGHYAEVNTALAFSVDMEVTGIPPGIPTTVFWRYTIFGGGSTHHEDNLLEEDSISVVNSMSVNGVNQFNNQFNFRSPAGLPGWNEWKNVTGNFRVVAGQDFNFSASSHIRLYLSEPAGPGGFGFGIDQNDGIFYGTITFSVMPLAPTPPNDESEMMTLFSLDIGSDSEISDPQADGDENFDPGDLYIKDPDPASPGPVQWGDDVVIFGTDAAPSPFPPFNPAPVGSGIPPDLLRPAFFDLDGSDMIEFSLMGGIYGPGNPSIAWYNDQCIYEGEYCFLSFEDDTPEHYSSLVPSVPVNSSSPGMAAIYSDLGVKNEAGEYDIDPYPASGVSMKYDLSAETDFHSWLGPDPAGVNAEDDDVDALDMILMNFDSGETPCTVWYIGADHEAAYNHITLSGPYLDPATVYEVTPTGPVPVIDSTHHGLPTGTDLADFEFAWVWDFNQNRLGLALLFAVHPDDPLTIENETGGLDPERIYYSFLDGTSQEYTMAPFQDPVDGITVWRSPLNGTTGFPFPQWGTKTWTGSQNNNWENALNWFPQGAPFHPEDVFIPLTARKPVIGISGMDCNSLNIQPGADVILKAGTTFSVKGP